MGPGCGRGPAQAGGCCNAEAGAADTVGRAWAAARIPTAEPWLAEPCPQQGGTVQPCCPLSPGCSLQLCFSPAAKKQGMGMSHSCLWAHRLSPVGTKGRRGCRASGAGSSAAKSPWPRQDGGRCTVRRGAEHRARWCPHPVPILSPGSRFMPGVSPVAGRAVGERRLLRASRAGGSHTGNCTGLWESKQVGWASGLWAQERSFALPYLSTRLLESPFWGAAPMPP